MEKLTCKDCSWYDESKLQCNNEHQHQEQHMRYVYSDGSSCQYFRKDIFEFLRKRGLFVK